MSFYKAFLHFCHRQPELSMCKLADFNCRATFPPVPDSGTPRAIWGSFLYLCFGWILLLFKVIFLLYAIFKLFFINLPHNFFFKHTKLLKHTTTVHLPFPVKLLNLGWTYLFHIVLFLSIQTCIIYLLLPKEQKSW